MGSVADSVAAKERLLFGLYKVLGEKVRTGKYSLTVIGRLWIPRQSTDIHYANWRINAKKQGEVDRQILRQTWWIGILAMVHGKKQSCPCHSNQYEL